MKKSVQKAAGNRSRSTSQTATPAWPHGHQPPKTGKTVVTPAMAEEWLKANVGNRPIQPKALAKVVKDIQSGEYQYNGESIIFAAKTWRLMDGQHRLTACVQSGIAIEQFVVTDVPEGAMPTINRRVAGSRSPAQGWMIAHGIQLNNDLVARCNVAMFGLTKVTEMTPDLFGVAYEKFADSLIELRKVFVDSRVTARAPFVAAFGVAHKADPNAVMKLAAAYHTGEHLSKGDPMLVLRNHVLNVTVKHSGSGTSDRVAQFSLALSLIDAALCGERRTLVRGNPAVNEKYAKIHGLVD